MCRLFEAAPTELAGALASALTTLLGPDQGSEVQRQALLSLTRVAAAPAPGTADALQPLLPLLLPSICAILAASPNSQVRGAGSQLLKVLLLGSDGSGSHAAAMAAAAAAGSGAKAFLTDAYLRRLAKLAEEEWAEVEEY